MPSGRIPKPNAERLTEHSTPMNEEIRVFGRVQVPATPSYWADNAKRWYRLLKRSGQAHLVDFSDWALALQAGDCLTYSERP